MMRAARSMSAAGMPVSAACRSGVHSRTDSATASKSFTRAAMNSSSMSPSRITTCSSALYMGTSVPVRNCKCTSAQRVSSMARGSATISRAPSRTAAFILRAVMG